MLLPLQNVCNLAGSVSALRRVHLCTGTVRMVEPFSHVASLDLITLFFYPVSYPWSLLD